jgi:hypothetical protein
MSKLFGLKGIRKKQRGIKHDNHHWIEVLNFIILSFYL